MSDLKITILKAFKEKSTPYVDISTLYPEFDIKSEDFILAFRELERNGLIASANTSNCGLRVGVNGTPSWAVVDLYITEEGSRLINPSKKYLVSQLIKITEHPVISALIVTAIIAIATYIFRYIK